MYNIYMKESKVILKIKQQDEKQSLFDYLLSYKVNKSFVNHLLNLKKIKLNGSNIIDKNYDIIEGDIIELNIEIEEIEPYAFDIKVIYEDSHIIIVDKPANILVHSDGNTNNTLTNAVKHYLNKKNEICNAYPIHRLDYETTGIVIFAKNKLMLSYLSVSIEKHELLKKYICLCQNPFSSKQGVINSPIAKDRHSNKQIVVKTGKEAESIYKVIKNGKISKVEVQIKHGRKHQIRVHMASIGHPIVGDKIYGNNQKESLKLHFWYVEFIHPYTKEKMIVKCKEKF